MNEMRKLMEQLDNIDVGANIDINKLQELYDDMIDDLIDAINDVQIEADELDTLISGEELLKRIITIIEHYREYQ